MYDRNHYFGLGPIPKLKPKLANNLSWYRNQYRNHISKGKSSYWVNLALVWRNFSIVNRPIKQNLLPSLTLLDLFSSLQNFTYGIYEKKFEKRLKKIVSVSEKIVSVSEKKISALIPLPKFSGFDKKTKSCSWFWCNFLFSCQSLKKQIPSEIILLILTNPFSSLF